jgi:hypothetical protein
MSLSKRDLDSPNNKFKIFFFELFYKLVENSPNCGFQYLPKPRNLENAKPIDCYSTTCCE